MKAIFCIGASHITALREGHRLRVVAGMAGGFDTWKAIGTNQHFEFDTRQYVITEAIDAEYAAIVSTVDVSAVFLCCGGGEHARMMFNNWPFDVYMPDDDPQQDISGDCDVIPYDVMLATCASYVLTPVPFVQRIRSLSSLPMYHILPPPPLSDLQDRAGDHLGPHFGTLMDRYGITPAPQRHKVWRLCCTAARQIYQDMAISVIEPPAEALDERGFLAPQYAGLDLVHGNAAYGALVVDRMVSIAANHASRGFG